MINHCCDTYVSLGSCIVKGIILKWVGTMHTTLKVFSSGASRAISAPRFSYVIFITVTRPGIRVRHWQQCLVLEGISKLKKK